MCFLSWLMVSSAALIKNVVVPGGIIVTPGYSFRVITIHWNVRSRRQGSLCLLLHPQCLLEHRRHPRKYLLNE